MINLDWRRAGTALGAVCVTALMFAAAGCGSDSPSGPSPQPTTTATPTPTPSATPTPTVTSISPTAGTVGGGTQVTISGTNFASGAAVTIGGVAATDVTVDSATSIRARTPNHAAGAADVEVRVGSLTGRLTNGYTFNVPSTNNAPPTIVSLRAQGKFPDPSQFIELGDTIDITAVVQDAETPVSNLTYQWTTNIGTIAGTGSAVKLTAPKLIPTPTTVNVTLTVIETYSALDSNGQTVTRENRTSSTTNVSAHDSYKEVASMAEDFLVEFSQQRLSPEQITRNFSDACSGKKDEIADIRNNQNTFQITSYRVDTPRVTVAFGGACPFRVRLGDACAQAPVEWHSRVKGSVATQTATGTDQVTAIYVKDHWELCISDFNGRVTTPLLPFKK